MSRIGQSELLGYLKKARVIRTGPDNMLATPYQEGVPTTHPRGVDPIRSVMLNPSSRLWGWRGRTTIQPNRHIDYKILRRISEKAWLINLIITHQQNRIRPFLKPSTDENTRGFQLRLKERDATPTQAQQARLKELTNFLLKTGAGPDPERRDDLMLFSMKAIRDYYTLDQLATELQWTVSRRLFAFWAVDPATIIRVTEEGYDGDDGVRYIQEIDGVLTAQYGETDLIFDYGNPRSDIDHSGYGYSLVEQAIDLILAQINAFTYNAAAMTEDNLPRGMILLNGDADLESVEAVQEYIIDIMSAGPQAKWRIPIIPSGVEGEGGKKAMEWVNFRTSNREQEYIKWTGHLWSSVAALFGIDLEEVGIRTENSGPVLADNAAPRIEASKSRGTSSILSFLESHFQKIVDKLEDWVDFEFIGYERDDPKVKSDQREADLRTYKSIDELRVEADLEPFNEEWSKLPLNPHVVQMVMADKQAAQMAAQGGMGQPGGGNPDDGPYGDEEYRNMLLGGDEEDGQPTQQRAESPKPAEGADRAEKSIVDEDVIEIIV